MQQLRTRVQPKGSLLSRMPAVRFDPVVHLTKGDIVNTIAETPKRFEERVAFGAPGLMTECISPALWMAHHVEQVASAARQEEVHARPILLEAPVAAMMHPDTPMACESAAARSRILPQELCLEVDDASLAQSKAEVARSISALRRRGFRVGIDATRSWCTPLDTDLRLMLDSVRVDAGKLWQHPDLISRVEAAAACGMAVIAENAHYRDGEDFAALGIEYARRPRTDA